MPVHSKAKRMEGPWSEPVEITWADGTSIQSTDPGVMWDMETGKARLTCGGGEIYEMSWDGEGIHRYRLVPVRIRRSQKSNKEK